MVKQNQPKWYFKTWSLVAAFILLGPFMLPLVWANPRFSKNAKIAITITVAALTWMITVLLVKSLKNVSDYYQTLFENLNY